MAEIHYLSYDPDAMWNEMMSIYAAAGGDVLFPGDEKYILLRSVQQMLIAAYAAHDNAARMRTQRYAVGDYLDLIGEGMRLPRVEAKAAQTTLAVTIKAASTTVSVAAGTQYTCNGMLVFETSEEAARTCAAGEEVTLSIPAVCTTEGIAGNGVAAGTLLQAMGNEAHVLRVELLSDSAGGSERETDEEYRERMEESSYIDTTTGPASQYRAQALAVSSEIMDARAVADSEYSEDGVGTEYGLAKGQVMVSLLFDEAMEESDRADLIGEVKSALSAQEARPLTDVVLVQEAERVPFSLTVHFAVDEARTGALVSRTQVIAAAEEYAAWQCAQLGRAFDPYRLISMLYSAGCSRVEIDEASTVNGGAVVYTSIKPTQAMQGSVVMEEMADE